MPSPIPTPRHKDLKPAVLKVKTSNHAEAQRSPCSLPWLFTAVYLKVKINNTLHNEHQCQAEFPLHTASNQPTSQLIRIIRQKSKFQPWMCMSSVTIIPDYGSTSYLPGSVFKYSLDLIHFFFPKVNNGEMNSPILLDACLPRK